MTPRLSHILISAAFVLVTLFGVALTVSHLARGKESAVEQQSHVDQGEANAHSYQAQLADLNAADLQAKVDNQAKDLDRLMAERNALRAKLLQQPAPSHDQDGSVAPPVDPLPDPRDAIISKDDEVIRALMERAVVKDSLITQLTVSRDQWKSSFEAERRRSAGLEIALDAQKTVNKADKWIGRLQGFAIGIGVGYVGSKL